MLPEKVKEDYSKDYELESAKELFHKYENLANMFYNKFKATAKIPNEELKQECYYFLYKAAVTFDPSKGNKFITYAWRVIQNGMFKLGKEWSAMPNIAFSLDEANEDLNRRSADSSVTYAESIPSSEDFEETAIANAECLSILQSIKDKIGTPEYMYAQLKLKGLSTDEIADTLDISVEDVRRLRASIRRKSGKLQLK